MLTEKQEAILAYIRSYQERECVPPSSRLVQRQFGFKTQTTAVRHLKALASQSLLEQFADGRWGVRQSVHSQIHFAEIPVYGSIPAGAPAFREQEPEGTLPVDRRMLGTRGELWAVRVHGDSMTGVHIEEGDLAILEKREARPGDIIAALVDGVETTLKHYLVENGHAVLRAANSRYADIFPRHVESQGVLVALFRKHGLRPV